MRRPYTEDELRTILEESDDSDDFSSGSDDNYEPILSYSRVYKNVPSTSSKPNEDHKSTSEENSTDSEISHDGLSTHELSVGANTASVPQDDTVTIWSTPPNNFVPRKQVSKHRTSEIRPHILRTDSQMEIFEKLFPRSLFMHLVQCTNERLEILRKSNKKYQNTKNTDIGEMKIVIGTMFIMSYNHVPSMRHYWSKHNSIGNDAIQSAIARDRFQTIASKLYFASPDKPADCSKTYYVDDIVECLKGRFQRARQDSPFQSIDESMTKFKGRSSLKQYMPMKPTKRGIKMWLRCDSHTGYVYDFNVYSGRENHAVDGTLGERVVTTLASTIKEPDVTLCFDRFFTSVKLLETLDYPALGTSMANRKKMPKITNKLSKGESVFKCSSSGLMFTKWHDTKEVIVVSNCHTSAMSTVQKKQKDGEKVLVNCPEMISFYRSVMGGVDLSDQMSSLYELDRKSKKWWKKIFYRLIMMTAVNSWIIFTEQRREKDPFIDFLVNLAESLIAEGQKTAAVIRSGRTGYHSKRRKLMGRTAGHLPIEGETRRRCTGCRIKQIERRTKTVCEECNIPLCKTCFAPYHK